MIKIVEINTNINIKVISYGDRYNSIGIITLVHMSKSGQVFVFVLTQMFCDET